MAALPELHVVTLKHFSIYQQLQLEEALLRTDHRSFCLINEGSTPAVVLGISSAASQVIDPVAYQQRPVPVIRRFSGGGTVYVDEETIFISMICNRKDVPIPSFPAPILHWNGSLYRRALRSADFRIQENDYAISKKKFGGNAQYISKERWVHHSTLLWDFSPAHMKILQMPPKVPQYRLGRTHEEFLCSLKHHVDSKEAFIKDYISSLKEKFTLKMTGSEELLHQIASSHRKSTALLTNF